MKKLIKQFLCKGLIIDIPTDHLIPRVAQRLNYILWIEDLLQNPVKAKGIDIGSLTNNYYNNLNHILNLICFIGCGTSCVFGLLICSLNKQWEMVSSEVNDLSIQWAQNNIKKNNFEERITGKN